MASIAKDPNGSRRILFVAPDGSRKTIRLGKVPQRAAEAVKVKIEELVASSVTGHAPSEETSRWVARLNEKLAQRLTAVGLIDLPAQATLGGFLKNYIEGRTDLKPGTRENLERARQELLNYFGPVTALRAITPGDADRWRLALRNRGLAENTVRRMCGRAKQFFNAARRQRLVTENPFADLKSAVLGNASRFRFITRDETEMVLEACPDVQWRLIVALSRFGGLRCPSEHLGLRWIDVDWANHRMRVPSPKTEHHAGREERWVPLFPELREHLVAAFEEAPEGSEYLITRYRNSRANLRTEMLRIIRRAGLEPWAKPFQNLRSTRETELTESYPLHVVCAWIGNSERVAAKHYLQVTEEHFRLAAESGAESGAVSAQKAAQQPAAASRLEPHKRAESPRRTAVYASLCDATLSGAETPNYPTRIRT